MRPTRFALACILFIAGCKSQAKKDLEQWKAASARFEDAKRFVHEAKLREAEDAYQHAQNGLFELRLRSPEMNAFRDEPPDGPVVAGLTAKAWGERWKKELHDAIVADFDALLASAAAGEGIWDFGRAFLTSHAPELDDRWVKPFDQVARAEAVREGEVYHFRCDGPEGSPELCDSIRAALAEKAAQPLTDGLALKRELSFGDITVAAALQGEDYAPVKLILDGSKEKLEEASRRLATRLRVEISTVTRRAKSSWDGRQTLNVEVASPARVVDVDFFDLNRANVSQLKAKMASELAALPAQKIE